MLISKPQRWLLGIIIVSSVIFVAFPEIDLAIMRLLYRPEGDFLLKGHPASLVYREFRTVYQWLLFGGIAVATVWRICGRVLFGLTWRRLGVIWGTLAIGAGLICTLLLKETFGRARPEHVVEFGGTRHFTPAWVLSSACDSNCSFVSGDVTIGFMALAFALLVTGKWRPVAILSAILFGSAIGVMRMLTGAHFPSDVLFAGLMVSFVAISCHYYLIERPAMVSRPQDKKDGKPVSRRATVSTIARRCQ